MACWILQLFSRCFRIPAKYFWWCHLISSDHRLQQTDHLSNSNETRPVDCSRPDRNRSFTCDLVRPKIVRGVLARVEGVVYAIIFFIQIPRQYADNGTIATDIDHNIRLVGSQILDYVLVGFLVGFHVDRIRNVRTVAYLVLRKMLGPMQQFEFHRRLGTDLSHESRPGNFEFFNTTEGSQSKVIDTPAWNTTSRSWTLFPDHWQNTPAVQFCFRLFAPWIDSGSKHLNHFAQFLLTSVRFLGSNSAMTIDWPLWVRLIWQLYQCELFAWARFRKSWNT